MVHLNPMLSIWTQLGCFCFTLSTLFTDLFVIRSLLLWAYTFFILDAILGSPSWPNGYSYNDASFSADGFVWATIGIALHAMAFTSLLLDEREVTLEEETGEAPLWRMFYRSSGVSARLFKSIMSGDMEFVEFEAGQDVPTKENFYIVYTGGVKVAVTEDGNESGHRIAKSGHMFNIKHVSQKM